MINSDKQVYFRAWCLHAGAPAVLQTGLQQQWFNTQEDIEEASKISRWLMTR